MQVKFGTRAQPPKSIDWNRFKEMQPDFSLITAEKHMCCPLLINLIVTRYILHIRRLIQQSCTFYRIQYELVHITPPACIQRATHILVRTDHPLKYINKFIPTINAYKYAFYPRVHIIAVWNRLPPAAVLHIAPSVSVFKSIAAPAIREMQPLHGTWTSYPLSLIERTPYYLYTCIQCTILL